MRDQADQPCLAGMAACRELPGRGFNMDELMSLRASTRDSNGVPLSPVEFARPATQFPGPKKGDKRGMRIVLFFSGPLSACWDLVGVAIAVCRVRIF